MVRKRSQVRTPLTGKETKRDRTTGKFMDQKADMRKFKGVRKENEERLVEIPLLA